MRIRWLTGLGPKHLRDQAAPKAGALRHYRPPALGRPTRNLQGDTAISQRIAARSDRGIKRSENQDQALAQELPDGSVLVAVADGVGGTGGGRTASAEAIQAVLAELSANPGAEPAAALDAAFSFANQQVRERAAQHPELEGMATTLVAAIVRAGSAWVANVGDSRAYLFQQGGLRQITQDHSWVAEQVRAGRLTQEEAEKSDFRNIITRGVGVAETVEQDTVGPVILPAGSVLLLCSDGLHRVVSDAEIAAVLASGAPDSMAARLIDLANRAGGPDNIAVAIVSGAD